MVTLWLVHGAHVGAGVVFAGGQVLWHVVVVPALLSLPAPDARRLAAALGPRVGPLLGGSALAAVIAGAARATWLGPVRSVVDLGGGYAAWAGVAVVATALSMAHGARAGRRAPELWFDGESWRPGAGAAAARSAAVSLGLLAVIGGAMVQLRFGG
jgi:hypothetical protein